MSRQPMIKVGGKRYTSYHVNVEYHDGAYTGRCYAYTNDGPLCVLYSQPVFTANGDCTAYGQAETAIKRMIKACEW